eukprot:1268263-Pleurochrysis_carterae.AAC.7
MVERLSLPAPFRAESSGHTCPHTCMCVASCWLSRVCVRVCVCACVADGWWVMRLAESASKGRERRSGAIKTRAGVGQWGACLLPETSLLKKFPSFLDLHATVRGGWRLSATVARFPGCVCASGTPRMASVRVECSCLAC